MRLTDLLSPTRPWLLLWLAALALGAGIGLRDPSPPDEPRFVLAARHMVETGQWLIPHRGSEFYAHKPAVFMWLQALAHQATGQWRVAFLLPSLLAALATLWLVHDLARRLWNRRIAAYAGFALFACLQFGLQAKRGQIDMVLVFWTTFALWGLARHLLRGPDWPALALAGFAAGVGTVTKGVGFLPLLILLPWWLAHRHARVPAGPTAGRSHWGWLPLGFLGGVAIWLLPMLAAVLGSDDPALRAYASEILFKQTGTRYAAAWHHVQPPWYYLQTIATLWLPGALLLPWLAPAWWHRMRRRDAKIISLVGWSLIVLVFFTASPGKREVYLFPALPAMCLAAAPLLPGLLRRRDVQWTLLAYVLLLSVLALAAGVSGLAGASWAERLALQRVLDARALSMLLWWLCALGGAGLALAAWSRASRAGVAAVGFNALLWTVYGLGMAPALDASSSARDFMRDVRERIGPRAELGLVAWREQHLLQAVGPTREFGFSRDGTDQWRDALAWQAAAPERRWLFALKQAATDCVDRHRLIDLGRSSRRDWVLVPGSAQRPGCVPAPAAETPQSANTADD